MKTLGLISLCVLTLTLTQMPSRCRARAPSCSCAPASTLRRSQRASASSPSRLRVATSSRCRSSRPTTGSSAATSRSGPRSLRAVTSTRSSPTLCEHRSLPLRHRQNLGQRRGALARTSRLASALGRRRHLRVSAGLSGLNLNFQGIVPDQNAPNSIFHSTHVHVFDS